MPTSRAGWNGPLQLDIPLLMESAGRELRIAADETTPRGDRSDRPGAGVSLLSGQQTIGGMHVRRGDKDGGGSLHRSHRFRILHGQQAVHWTNKKVYAEIQDVGGTIGPYDATKNKGIRLKRGMRTAFGTSGGSGVMLGYVGGEWRFFTKRKGFTLKGQNYTSRAVDLMLPRLQVRWLAAPTAGVSPSGTAPAIGGTE